MGWGLPREGVEVKKFGMSLDNQENQTLWRDIPYFARISRGRPKSSRTKKFVFNVWPLLV